MLPNDSELSTLFTSVYESCTHCFHYTILFMNAYIFLQNKKRLNKTDNPLLATRIKNVISPEITPTKNQVLMFTKVDYLLMFLSLLRFAKQNARLLMRAEAFASFVLLNYFHYIIISVLCQIVFFRFKLT